MKPINRLVFSLIAIFQLLWLLPTTAKESHSQAAIGFWKQLGETNEEKHYRAMSDWVFQAGPSEQVRRERMKEALWILTDSSDDDHAFKYTKEVWGDQFLEKLDSHPDRPWWAWMLAGDLLSELENSGKIVNGTFIRGEADWDVRVDSSIRD